jgi:hypothetical protein
MSTESSLAVAFVNSGFVLTTEVDDVIRTEVFTSPAKLIKAIRTAIDEQSLVVKKTEAEE